MDEHSTRRDFLKAGLAGGLGAALAPALTHSAAATAHQAHRTIRTTLNEAVRPGDLVQNPATSYHDLRVVQLISRRQLSRERAADIPVLAGAGCHQHYSKA